MMRLLSLWMAAGLCAVVAARAAEQEPAAPTAEESRNAVAKALAYVDEGKITVDGRVLTKEGVELESVKYTDRVTQDIMVKLKVKGTAPAVSGPKDRPPPHATIELTFTKAGAFCGAGVGMPAGLQHEPVIRFTDENRPAP
jgi:hypothetical protein